jgi:hypothetical protein
MGLTIEQVYEARFGPKLPLPKSVQDNIAKLRITPAVYKPARPMPRHVVRNKIAMPENWREKVLVDYVRKVKEYDDPEYYEVFSILNKIAPPTLDALSAQIVGFIGMRDEQFRLRIVTLLFNKAISENVFAGVMADCAVKLVESVPEVREDLHAQVELFPKLYNMTETLVFPSASEPRFDEKVIAWMKQKDQRRGYSKFLTQLFVRNLVTEKMIYRSLEHIIADLNETARQARTPQTEENTTHFVDFLFESAKILPVGTREIRTLISESLGTFLKIPRQELPCLCMRSRFRAEDTLKCVQ